MNSIRFWDRRYVEDFKQGKMPHIHDNIVHLVEVTRAEGDNYLDLGGCTGLLAGQLHLKYPNAKVVVVESNPKYIKTGIKTVPFEKLKVTKDTFFDLGNIIDRYQINTILARRIFPEISENGVDTVYQLAEMLYLKGIDKIYIEGRQKVQNATAELSDIDKEIACFLKYYRLRCRYFNTALLQRNEVI